MPCEQYKEDLQAFLDGELSPPRRSAVETHVTECDKCREVVKELEAVSRSLAKWTDRVPSDKFEFLLQFKLSTENLPSEETTSQPSEEPRPARAVRKVRPQPSFAHWLYTGWRPVALICSVLLLAVAVVALYQTGGRRQPLASRPVIDMVKAFMEAGPDGNISESYIYAASTAKKAVEAETLDPARVASSEMVYNFLVSMESSAERNAGWRLINLLSSRNSRYIPVQQAAGPSALAALQSLLFQNLYAASTPASPLAEARRYELQGRMREALTRYAAITSGAEAARARLAEGSLRLRSGDLDGAATALQKASEENDRVVTNTALALISEVETARKARALLPAQRETAKTAADWLAVALMEVRAYDFRSAANSFMKAANAAEDADGALRREARFRSAWCQKEVGQVSTAVYGYRSVAAEANAPNELEYCASILEAISLSSLGRYEESVAVCRNLVKTVVPSGARNLEALVYFHKGCIELRHLNDANSAAESLGRVAAGGQGNLSFAAQYLLQSKGR